MAESTAAQTADIGPITRARASLVALERLDRIRQSPHTPPTPADLATLRGWTGWGPLAPAVERSRTGTWKEIGGRLAFLLPEDHYNDGVQATYNAFYTPPPIAAACWQMLTDLGFSGGKILEPGCGAGAFMAATPDETPAAWIGVERDPTSAAIARILHPNATIHASRLEETPLPSYGMDAVLGNVPFADTTPRWRSSTGQRVRRRSPSRVPGFRPPVARLPVQTAITPSRNGTKDPPARHLQSRVKITGPMETPARRREQAPSSSPA